jgi:hypothetical protein
MAEDRCAQTHFHHILVPTESMSLIMFVNECIADELAAEAAAEAAALEAQKKIADEAAASVTVRAHLTHLHTYYLTACTAHTTGNQASC